MGGFSMGKIDRNVVFLTEFRVRPHVEGGRI